VRPVSAMRPYVLVDARGNEVGRCGMESHVSLEAGQSVDLGPLGLFDVLDVRSGDPVVLVVEPRPPPR
jgi:hypothetical protein